MIRERERTAKRFRNINDNQVKDDISNTLESFEVKQRRGKTKFSLSVARKFEKTLENNTGSWGFFKRTTA